ncbi:MAG TPA: ATP-binding cassette domain-containing protein [Noviherbaspirillum sp.]|uniref:cell division ATP-binding protein FtsE n=1 Tax=Noviherbaspirillum sp. TaxID=1926288 RepID=UPI002D596CBA|nr:ATP-binding cassette domain-containing protein [Noviherbaspirillum sp.]HYD93775.1 ATP-binding cassette domain-containing protein [Noviherbaspirillum sp.]
MIEFNNVSKQYGRGTSALADINLTIGRGELVFLSGPSGAGKSTLLKMIAVMERPSAGTVSVNGQDVGSLNASGLPYLRRNLGLIFQPQCLLNDRSVLTNVMLPLQVTGTAGAEAEKRARAALDKVGLLDKAGADPMTLSGGEQQRVAIARAIVNRPQIILADEPTANLDRGSAKKVMDALKAFHDAGVTCLIATHDEAILANAPRIIYLEHGRLMPTPAGDLLRGAA